MVILSHRYYTSVSRIGSSLISPQLNTNITIRSFTVLPSIHLVCPPAPRRTRPQFLFDIRPVRRRRVRIGAFFPVSHCLSAPWGFTDAPTFTKQGDKHPPSADNLYFWQFLVLASGVLAPVLVPLAALGRAPLLTLLLARHLRKLPTRRRRRSLQSRLLLSAQKRMSTVEPSRQGAATVCPHRRTMLTTIRRTSATSSIPAARPISGRLSVKYVSVSFLIAHRGALSTTSRSRP